MPDITWTPYRHTLGPRACGYLAFSVADVVTSPQAIAGIALRRADGGVVRFDDQVRCTTCNRLLPLPLPMPAGAEVDV